MAKFNKQINKVKKLLETDEFQKQIINRVSLFALVGVVLVAGLGFGSYKVFDAAQEKRSFASLHQERTEEMEDLIKDTESLEDNLDALGENKEKLLELIPEKVNEDKLLKYLADTASDSGVFLASYKPTETLVADENATYNAYPFKLSVSGSYESIVAFFEQLETGSRYIDALSIDLNLDLGSLLGDANETRLNAEIEATAYSQQESTLDDGFDTENSQQDQNTTDETVEEGSNEQ